MNKAELVSSMAEKKQFDKEGCRKCIKRIYGSGTRDIS